MQSKHAILTGGSSGIGRALARKLAAQGYDISLIARRQSLLEAAQQDIQSCAVRAGQRVDIHVADVAERAQAASAVHAAIASLGAPDLLVTSAGMAVPGYFGQISDEIFEQTMAVNYFGTLYSVRAALPAMRQRRCGRIVLVSSGAALLGIFGYSAYGASKFAVRGLAETLRAELRSDGVQVSVVYPPDTETPMLIEENKTKPAETKLITALAKPMSADAVAETIMRGMHRGAFAITPGLTVSLMQRMPGAILPILRWYCDRLAASVQKQDKRGPASALT
jgi:3-dehydrosphinganine reductase